MHAGKIIRALFFILILISNHVFTQWKSQVNLYGGYFKCFHNINDTLYIGTDRGLFRTVNEGKTWSTNLASSNYQNFQCWSIASTSKYFFYLNNNYLLRSSRALDGWSEAISSLYCNKLLTIEDTLFASSDDGYASGVYVINPESCKYRKAFGKGTSYNFATKTIVAANKVLYAVTEDSSCFFRSSDFGKTWTNIKKGLPESRIYPYLLTSEGDAVYAVAGYDEKTEAFYINNQTDEWKKFKLPLPGANNVFSIVSINGTFYAALSDYISSTSNTYCAIYKTTDLGANWIKLNDNTKADGYNLLYSFKNKLYQGAYNPYDKMFSSGVFYTANDGVTWVAAGLKPNFNCIEFYYDYLWYNYNTYLGSDNGIFIDYTFKNFGLPENTSVLSIHRVKSPNVGGNFYVGTDKGLYYYDSYIKWVRVEELKPYDSVNCISTLFTTPDYITFAGTNNGIFTSKNWGGAFKYSSEGLTNKRVKTIFIEGSKSFAGTEGGIFYSSDFGNKWLPENTGLNGQALFVKSIVLQADTLYIATNDGIYKTGISELKWIPSGFKGKSVNNVHSAGNYLFTATSADGVFYSSDFGNKWNALNDGLNGLNVKFVKSYMNNLYAVLEDYGFYMRTFKELNLPVELGDFSAVNENNKIKVSWTTITEKNNRGFEIQRKTDISKEYMTVGFVQGKGTIASKTDYLFTDDLSKMNPKSIKYRLKQIDYDGTFNFSREIKAEGICPERLELYQNYPNPFNPFTSIKYAVPKECKVTLRLFNALGQKVKELVNEVKQAGYYEIILNASQLSSGIYFYCLDAGGVVMTKKLIFQK